MGEKREGEKGKRREEKGGDSQGLVDTLMSKILKNSLMRLHIARLCSNMFKVW